MTLGASWTQTHIKDKRTQLADAMEKAFAGNDDKIDASAKTRALQWTIPGFEPFDTRALGNETANEKPTETANGNAEPESRREEEGGAQPAA